MIVRADCFWYDEIQDMGATVSQCELAEPWTCPCDWDCDWYVSTEGVKAHIYNLLLDKREQKEK